MGSRIMHLMIANRIAEYFPVEDKQAFLLGGIAPDAVSPKELSHFFKGELQDYSRRIDYKGFLDKYRSEMESDYILGYFVHLIADDLWLKGFYLPWLKNRLEADKELSNLYYHDFRLLNAKLLEHYGCANELNPMLRSLPTICELQEVKSQDVESFLPDVINDMEYDEDVINEKLNVFTFDQIIGYVETSVDKGLVLMKSVNL
ncbi:zinc dependent phospholipase C family protein [Shouchella clausii]|uniref:zinc dependent phospholipase C family protein n=1 Tax=Shouchella clausii TaxID=79880 RepID=UPI002147ABDB|nr:zinc dependent phospholipase C family protein [Shouchella clausii]MCR1289951.1 zinc dependent phospholipase C family protein [Shouchella clausii]